MPELAQRPRAESRLLQGVKGVTWLELAWSPHSMYGLYDHRWPAQCQGFRASCPVPQGSLLPTFPFLRGVSAAACDMPLPPLAGHSLPPGFPLVAVL